MSKKSNQKPEQGLCIVILSLRLLRGPDKGRKPGSPLSPVFQTPFTDKPLLTPYPM